MFWLNVLMVFCWSLTSICAFVRAHENTKINDGWASDAFFYGCASAILALYAVGEVVGK